MFIALFAGQPQRVDIREPFVGLRGGAERKGGKLLVDKRASRVHPEPGPNMMWNTKYGMINGDRGMRGNYFQTGSDDPMPMSFEQATQIADDYLSRVSPDTETEEPDTFYGYYTLYTERDSEVAGMLSVNGYSGEVWYHSWHGPFVALQEEEE